MSNKKVWFITGAGRGMGTDFAKAALASGHAVVATGRNSRRGVEGVGNVERPAAREHERARTPRRQCELPSTIWPHRRACQQCRQLFRRLLRRADAGQFDRQLSVSLIGPMNVTRAVLPVMRKQRAGHIISISSSAGLAAGFDFVSAYAASKFGLEGWMESLQAEVAPFGIYTIIVNPRFSSTRSSSRRNPRITPNRPSPTTTGAADRSSTIGNHRTDGNPATPPSSRERSSRLPARSRRRDVSSPAQMPLRPRSRRSPICRRRSTRTGTSRRRSLLMFWTGT